MSEFEGSAPSGEGSAADAPGSTGAEATSQDVGAVGAASADSGNAPGIGGDVTVGDPAQAPVAPAAVPAGFEFGGRRFESQKKAEDFFRSQIGRLPETQRKIAEMERSLAERNAAFEALQRALAQQAAGGQEQGRAGQSPATPQGPKPFAERLAEGGPNSQLAFIAQLAEEKGIAHALYVFAEQQDAYMNERVQSAIEENVAPLQQQSQFQQAMGSVVGAARGLAQQYPELDEHNNAPEAVEARQEIVARWKTLPRELQLQDPERAWRLAVMEFREANGTPIFAAQPGTSGSPSARAVAASEQAFGQAAASPVDGVGVPRPRPSGTTPSAEDDFESDILSADDRYAKTLDGKSLGWRRVG
jgi:hypothetical protein